MRDAFILFGETYFFVLIHFITKERKREREKVIMSMRMKVRLIGKEGERERERERECVFSHLPCGNDKL